MVNTHRHSKHGKAGTRRKAQGGREEKTRQETGWCSG
nr:MAG TPA: hypothetical protein [Caudoviricetes sp.]